MSELENHANTLFFKKPVSILSTQTDSLLLYGGVTIHNTTDATGVNSGGSFTTYGGFSIQKKLFVGGQTQLADSTESTDTSTGALLVSGGVGIVKNVNIGGELNVSQNTTLGNDLRVLGNINLESDLQLSGDATIGSDLRLVGAATMDSTLDVLGDATVGSQFRVVGATNLDSSLQVAGDSTIGSDLRLVGAAVMDSTLDVSGDATIGSQFRVVGATNLDSSLQVAGDSTIGSDLRLVGAAVMDSTLDVSGDATVGSQFRVAGATNLDSSLQVAGHSTIGSDLRLVGAAVMDSTLDVSGDATVGSQFRVAGATNLDSSVQIAGDSTIGSDLRLVGAAVMDSTLDVSGDATVGSQFRVAGATNLDSSLQVAGHSTIGSDLRLVGAAVMDSTLDVTGDATIGSQFRVAGATNLDSSVQIAGDSTVGSELRVIGKTILEGATTIDDTLIAQGDTTVGSNLYIFGPSLLIPTGTTAQRPEPEQVGLIRYNTETSQFEGFGAGNEWGSLGGVIDVNQDTYISAEMTPGGNDDNLRFFTNATEHMRITSDGLVGIRTTDPSVDLDVVGDFRLSQDATIGNKLTVVGDSVLSVDGAVTAGSLYVQGPTTIAGDLTVYGTQTQVTIQSTTLEVGDNLIKLNAGPLGIADAGFLIQRGTIGNFATTFFNTPDNEFVFGYTDSEGTSGQLDLIVDSETGSQYADLRAQSINLHGDINMTAGTATLADVDITTARIGTETIGNAYVTESLRVSLNGAGPSATSLTSGGTLTVAGGASIEKNMFVGSNLVVTNKDITPSLGDISKERAYIGGSNQTEQAVTGLSFDSALVRSFNALVSAQVLYSNSANNEYANYELKGLQKNGTWVINSSYIGDYIGLNFTIDNAGQVYYSSPDFGPDFTELKFGFRATTTSIYDVGNDASVIASYTGGTIVITGENSPWFEANGSEVYYEGNVGIGTANPTYRLHVAGGNALFDQYVTAGHLKVTDDLYTNILDAQNINATNSTFANALTDQLHALSGTIGNLRVTGNLTANLTLDEIEATAATVGTFVVTGESTFDGHLLPSQTETFDLGSPTKRWRSAYIASNTVYIGDTPISAATQGTISFGETVLATSTTSNVETNLGGAVVRVTNTSQAVNTSSGALVISGGVGIAKDVYIGGNMTTGSINIDGSIYQNGVPYIASQWTGTVGSDISYTSGNVLMSQLNISGVSTTGSLIVGTSSSLASASATSMNVSGAASAGSLVVSGAASASTLTASTSSSLAAASATSMNVSGAASAGSLVVSGAASASTLTASTSSSLAAASATNLNVSGAASAGSLVVSGLSNLDNIIVNNGITTGSLHVSSESHFTGTLNAQTTSTGNLHVTGDTIITGNLTVYGTAGQVSINSTTLDIGDNKIKLNSGPLGLADAGFLIARGTAANYATMFYNTPENEFLFGFTASEDTTSNIVLTEDTITGKKYANLSANTINLQGDINATAGNATLSTLTVSGASSAGSLVISGNASASTLTATTSSSLASASATSMNISGSVTTGTLNITDTVSIRNITTEDIMGPQTHSVFSSPNSYKFNIDETTALTLNPTSLITTGEIGSQSIRLSDTIYSNEAILSVGLDPAIFNIKNGVMDGIIKHEAFGAHVFSNYSYDIMRIDGSGNVGIGSNSPVYKLDVSGIGRLSDLIVSGSSSTGSMNVSGASTMGSLLVLGGISAGNVTASSALLSGSLAVSATVSASGVSAGSLSASTSSSLASASATSMNVSGGATMGSLLVLGGPSGGARISSGDVTASSAVLSGSLAVSLSVRSNSVSTGTLITTTSSSLAAASATSMNISGASSSGSLVVSGNIGIGTTNPPERLHIMQRSSTLGSFITLDATGGANGRSYIIGSSLSGNNSGAGNFEIYDANAGATRLIVNSTGNIGIGTTSASGLLNIVSTHTSGTSKEMFRTNYDTNWGMRLVQNFAGTGDIRYEWKHTYNGTENDVLTFRGSNVGIGTVTPDSRFNVHGNSNGEINAKIRNISSLSNAYSALRIDNDSADDFIFFLNSSTRTADGGVNAATIRNDAGNLNLHSKGQNGISIEATSGNVGIGTTSASTKLDVRSSSGTNTMAITNTSASGNSTIDFFNSSNVYIGSIGYGNASSASGATFQDKFCLYHNAKDLVFVGSSATERMRVTAAGSVGIGITNPGQALDVVGQIRFGDTLGKGSLIAGSNWVGIRDNSGADRIAIKQSNGFVGIGTNDPSASLDVINSVATQYPVIARFIAPSANGTKPSPRLVLGTNATNGVTMSYSQVGDANAQNVFGIGHINVSDDQMVLSRVGNVGIGTQTPAYKLHVIGDIYASGDITAYSDKRLKTDIRTVDNALEKVNKMRGVYYTHIESQKPSVGVIAQEMEEILPEVIADKGEYKGVAYGNIVGVLIEAIKELSKEIEELKNNKCQC